MVPAPSRSERLRVLRALYRRQIIFNMWAMGRRALAWGDADNAALINSNDSAGESLGLLAPLQSWEMQQVDDVNQIVIHVCLSLCAAGLDQGQPIDEDLFDEMCVHTNVLVQFMWEHPALSEGLPMVVPISSDSGPDGLWNYYGLSRTYKLSYLAWPWWEQWIGRGPVDAQEDEGGQGEGNTRGRLDFTVDRVHLVPFAWADALGGRIVNCFGEVLCEGISEAAAESEYELRSRSSSIELWSAVGFSLWDRQRVETLKGLSQLGEFHTGWILRWHVVPR
ncbi:RAS small monomeric GTPase [Geosmithia morbida]|uniref:RAS small monomeric GTPase n=1 Tax=Geosmithia morbida TaxID=1094350 RepID=A0A9P5D6A6_9HYPO|nr:RAS small monomeric GTPase [Geosmithia morbida]KAF4123319.1 RAS small monomeric GTPase [Geosmithia morbida]